MAGAEHLCNIFEWGRENKKVENHCSKQTCICLTFDPLTLHKMWKWLLFCENDVTINYHHASAVKLRNTCRGNLKQRLVSLI